MTPATTTIAVSTVTSHVSAIEPSASCWPVVIPGPSCAIGTINYAAAAGSGLSGAVAAE